MNVLVPLKQKYKYILVAILFAQTLAQSVLAMNSDLDLPPDLVGSYDAADFKKRKVSPNSIQLRPKVENDIIVPLTDCRIQRLPSRPRA